MGPMECPNRKADKAPKCLLRSMGLSFLAVEDDETKVGSMSETLRRHYQPLLDPEARRQPQPLKMDHTPSVLSHPQLASGSSYSKRSHHA